MSLRSEATGSTGDVEFRKSLPDESVSFILFTIFATFKEVMKKVFHIIFLLAVPLILFAQEKRPRNLPAYDYKKLHFGFTVGGNIMDFSFQRDPGAANYLYGDVSVVQPGFQVNVVSDLRLSDYWTLRFLPGVNFGQREFTYYNPSDMSDVTEMLVESSFLDFPLLLKYRSERLNNYRPYVIGGLSFRYDMAARKDYDEDTEVYVRLKPADLYLEMGFGVDTYLQYFKFAPEIKLAVGLANILVDQPASQENATYVESFKRLRSFLVMVNFHFE